MKVGVALVDVLHGEGCGHRHPGGAASPRARWNRATGRGQLAVQPPGVAGQPGLGLPGDRRHTGEHGNRHPSIAPYETLTAKDGHLAICCGNDGQFRKLTAVLGIPATAADVRFASNGAWVRNRADLVQVLESALAVDTVDAWTARLASVGVPAGRVGSIADAFDLAERLGLSPRFPSARRLHHSPATPSR